MNIYKVDDYDYYYNLSMEFLDSIHQNFNESKDNKSKNYKQVQKKIINDFKLNIELVGIFGAGIGFFYPIVDKLMTNTGNLEPTKENVVLATICAFTIICLEEKKIKSNIEGKVIKDSKSMLEELRMNGLGDGIIKLIIKAFNSIKSIFSLIIKHSGAVVAGFIDMLSYTSFLIPILNGVYYIIGKYDLNMDTLVSNFIGLSIGIGTIIAKHGIIEIINRLKGKININKKKVIGEIETPVIQKFGDKTYGNDLSSKDEMITEQ